LVGVRVDEKVIAKSNASGAEVMERLSIPPEKARTAHQFVHRFGLPDREVHEDFQSAERVDLEGEDGSCRVFRTAR
jgi:hypothetical protein